MGKLYEEIDPALRAFIEGQRSQLSRWAEQKGEQGLELYQIEKNASSIDALPALRWVEGNR